MDPIACTRRCPPRGNAGGVPHRGNHRGPTSACTVYPPATGPPATVPTPVGGGGLVATTTGDTIGHARDGRTALARWGCVATVNTCEQRSIARYPRR